MIQYINFVYRLQKRRTPSQGHFSPILWRRKGPNAKNNGTPRRKHPNRHHINPNQRNTTSTNHNAVTGTRNRHGNRVPPTPVQNRPRIRREHQEHSPHRAEHHPASRNRQEQGEARQDRAEKVRGEHGLVEFVGAEFSSCPGRN